MYSTKAPKWIELGSYVQSKKGKLDNESEGFFYIPLLSTLESLLHNEHVYNHVSHVVFVYYC